MKNFSRIPVIPVIPPITDPLGRFWDQPALSEISVSLSHAWMTPAAFNNLHTYQYSIPTGIYAGKMWKVQDKRRRWLLAYITDAEEPGQCYINYLRIGVDLMPQRIFPPEEMGLLSRFRAIKHESRFPQHEVRNSWGMILPITHPDAFK